MAAKIPRLHVKLKMTLKYHNLKDHPVFKDDIYSLKTF